MCPPRTGLQWYRPPLAIEAPETSNLLPAITLVLTVLLISIYICASRYFRRMSVSSSEIPESAEPSKPADTGPSTPPSKTELVSSLQQHTESVSQGVGEIRKEIGSILDHFQKLEESRESLLTAASENAVVQEFFSGFDGHTSVLKSLFADLQPKLDDLSALNGTVLDEVRRWAALKADIVSSTPLNSSTSEFAKPHTPTSRRQRTSGPSDQLENRFSPFRVFLSPNVTRKRKSSNDSTVSNDEILDLDADRAFLEESLASLADNGTPPAIPMDTIDAALSGFDAALEEQVNRLMKASDNVAKRRAILSQPSSPMVSSALVASDVLSISTVTASSVPPLADGGVPTTLSAAVSNKTIGRYTIAFLSPLGPSDLGILDVPPTPSPSATAASEMVELPKTESKDIRTESTSDSGKSRPHKSSKDGDKRRSRSLDGRRTPSEARALAPGTIKVHQEENRYRVFYKTMAGEAGSIMADQVPGLWCPLLPAAIIRSILPRVSSICIQPGSAFARIKRKFLIVYIDQGIPRTLIAGSLLQDRIASRAFARPKQFPVLQSDCSKVTTRRHADLVFYGTEGQRFSFNAVIVDKNDDRHFDQSLFILGRDFVNACIVGLDSYQLGDGQAKGRLIVQSTQDREVFWNTTYEPCRRTW